MGVVAGMLETEGGGGEGSSIKFVANSYFPVDC